MSNIYLVGFMGAGKSSVGRLLARSLHRTFIDLDLHIEESAGMPISRIFEEAGEEAFRQREREALEWAFGVDHSVVATGGGAACDATNRGIMRANGGCSVFLDVPWNVLAARLAKDHEHRPMFTAAVEARRLYERRRPHYEQAGWTVALTGVESAEQAASLVLEALAGAPCAT